MPDTQPNKLAAIRFNRDDHIGAILKSVVDRGRDQGLRIEGYLQTELPDEASCCSLTYLEGIASGDKVRISQALGSGSTGCRLDPQALAEASGTLLRDLDTKPDLLVVNRFGRGEAEGHGFRSAIEKAFAMGIPVLTAVRDDYLDEWRSFGAEYAAELPARTEDVSDWCDAVTVPVATP